MEDCFWIDITRISRGFFLMFVTHFRLMFPLNPPWKYEKNRSFSLEKGQIGGEWVNIDFK